MKKLVLFFLAAIIVLVACKHEPPVIVTPTPIGGGTCNPDTVYFQNVILPLFVSNCAMSGCHDAASHREGIILTDYVNIIQTGNIVGGNPSAGDIYQSIVSSGSNVMPPAPASPLTSAQADLIYKWINQGALNNYCIESCDTADVRYSTKVKPLIDAQCVGCHNSSATSSGTDYSTYAALQGIALDGNLIGTISHTSGYPLMPKGGSKLSDCDIRMVQIWINAGAPNN